jgi:cell division protein FtsW (lipid II flippase)
VTSGIHNDNLLQDDAAVEPVTHFPLELLLFTIAAVFIATNYVALTILRPGNLLPHVISFVAWSGCAVVGHTLLNRYLPRRDRLLFPVVMFMSGWGLVVIDRLVPPFAERQSTWLIVSVAAMVGVASMPHILRWLRNYRYLWLICGLGLLTSTIILGSNPSGQAGAPQLWLGFNGVYFQPSEALKIILVVFLASYLAEQYPSLRAAGLLHSSHPLALSPRVLGPILLMWGVSVVVLIWQRDLGTAFLFFMVFLLLLYAASGNALILASGAVLIAVAGIVAYHLFAVVQLRVDIWINPWPEADGRAYQLVQSLQAFAAGGVLGQGIGQGSPFYVPVAHSDFLFAALAEEWGLLGVIVVLICVAVLVVRGMRIATLQSGSPFRALLAVGLSTLIGAQSILIMGGVIRLLPLTGVTLPFFSYGGSSLLMSFVLIGLLLRLSATED